MYVDCIGKESSNKSNEYNNNKLVDPCKTVHAEKCCTLCVGNIMPLYLYNEWMFIDLLSSIHIRKCYDK